MGGRFRVALAILVSMLWTVIASIGSLVSAATSWSWWRSPAARAARIAEAAVNDVREEADRTQQIVRGPEQRLGREAAAWQRRARRRRFETAPLERLREAGAERVRWSALQTGGVTTVGDVRARSVAGLERIDGVGRATAERLVAAAELYEKKLETVAAPLPDPELSDDGAEDLARAALDVLAARRAVGDVAARLERERRRLESELGQAKRGARLGAWAARRLRGRDDDEAARASRRVARDAFDVVEGELGDRAREARKAWKAQASSASLDRPALIDAWRARHAEIATSIAAALEDQDTPSIDASAGTRMPSDIVERVLALDFTPRGLRVDMRRYQDFGARYIVAQERTVLGDDMGLGKTLQSLAAMCHLVAENDEARFLVVAPATVVHGWMREAAKFTELRTHLLHGPARGDALAAWLRDGGLAITSYTTLTGLALHERWEPESRPLALLVADEAHYVKNPEATRSRALAVLLRHAERVCLMTGTPLENRLEEFQHLLRLVRPDLPALEPSDEQNLAWSVDPERFGVDVAEAYLRRNQRDVLVELPERIDTDHWLDIGDDEDVAYRHAVAAGNIMAMRRAVTIGSWRAGQVSGALPVKIERLEQLVVEAREAGRKVLVFSFFLDVLDVIAERIDVLGVVRGNVGPAERQRLLDEFTSIEGSAVLLGQITAAGVGLNIQAASVVVLMEPQWKPSTEEQAIARAHRMGQPDVVLVHRLLARDGIDERISELLADKHELFERFVTPSAVKDACREATEPALARLVLDAERARLGVGNSPPVVQP